MKGIVFLFFVGLCCSALLSCAGQRQGVVCDEIEYRYNSMSYSPDQRVFMEEELRACREEEAKKKQASAESRQGIYARYAAQDTTKKVHTAGDSVPVVEASHAPVDSAVAPGDTAAATDSVVTDSTTDPTATETVATEEVAQ